MDKILEKNVNLNPIKTGRLIQYPLFDPYHSTCIDSTQLGCLACAYSVSSMDGSAAEHRHATRADTMILPHKCDDIY